MSKTQRNILRAPGLLIRIPLVLILWHVLPVLTAGAEWLCENVFVGIER